MFRTDEGLVYGSCRFGRMRPKRASSKPQSGCLSVGTDSAPPPLQAPLARFSLIRSRLFTFHALSLLFPSSFPSFVVSSDTVMRRVLDYIKYTPEDHPEYEHAKGERPTRLFSSVSSLQRSYLWDFSFISSSLFSFLSSLFIFLSCSFPR